MLGKDGIQASNSHETLGAETSRAVVEYVGGYPADRFLADILSSGLGGTRGVWNPTEITARLDDPVKCLRSIYARYAFLRRGKERKVLADLACAALDKALGDGCELVAVDLDDVWRNYCEACEAAGRKTAPDLNRGVVLGLAGLAQAIARDRGMSLARHVAAATTEHGRIEPVFFSIVELRGVGPKVASTMLRDWVHTYNVEEKVVFRDSIYLQPVDHWVRASAPLLLEDAGADAFPDWILAGKLGKAARNARVSGIRLNMGVSWLGLEAGSSDDPDAEFLDLLRHSVT